MLVDKIFVGCPGHESDSQVFMIMNRSRDADNDGMIKMMKTGALM